MVRAKELRSGVEQSIEVKPQYGLSDDEVERMLLDSITHAREDMATRALVESQTEGRQMLDTTENFLQKNGTLLTEEEIKLTRDAMKDLTDQIDGTDKDKIQLAIEKLNDFSRPFAERVMDIAISTAMKGKKIG